MADEGGEHSVTQWLRSLKDGTRGGRPLSLLVGLAGLSAELVVRDESSPL
jgi:hypothetical protein